MGLRFVGIVLLALLVCANASADPVQLRVGTLAVDGSRYAIDMQALANQIEKRTRRQVRIRWVTGGDERTMVTAIGEGRLDGGGFSETGLSALVPEMAAWQSPALFHDYEDVDRATAALDDRVRELYRKRELRFLMWADLGFAHLFSRLPITSLREVLVRAAPQLVMPIDGALTKEIVDGRATAWALPPLYQIVIGAQPKVMTDLRYRYVIGGLVLGEAAWAKLSPAQQQIVTETCREYEPKLRASWRAETERGLAALAKAGVERRTFTSTETTGFRDAAAASRARAPSDMLTAIASLLGR